jgi:hypothetical protein
MTLKRTNGLLWLVIVLAVLVAMLAGCQPGNIETQRQAFRAAAETYASACYAIDQHARAGNIAVEQAIRIQAIRGVAIQALVAWEFALENDGDTDAAMAAFNRAIGQLIAERMAAEGRETT